MKCEVAISGISCPNDSTVIAVGKGVVQRFCDEHKILIPSFQTVEKFSTHLWEQLLGKNKRYLYYATSSKSKHGYGVKVLECLKEFPSFYRIKLEDGLTQDFPKKVRDRKTDEMVSLNIFNSFPLVKEFIINDLKNKIKNQLASTSGLMEHLKELPYNHIVRVNYLLHEAFQVEFFPVMEKTGLIYRCDTQYNHEVERKERRGEKTVTRKVVRGQPFRLTQRRSEVDTKKIPFGTWIFHSENARQSIADILAFATGRKAYLQRLLDQYKRVEEISTDGELQ